MDRDEGLLLLLRRSKRLAEDTLIESINAMERSAAEAIYQLVDGLPLALDQAAAYIEENQCTFGDYLDLYRSHRAALLKRRGKFGTKEYPHSVATTWSLSCEQVEKSDSVAIDVLRLCAFLHPDAIPEEMIAAGAAAPGSVLQQVAHDPIRLDNAIGELRRYSLVRRNTGTKMLTIHRLLQTVLRDAMTPENEKAWAEQTVHIVNQAFPDEESLPWQQYERYLPQALSCAALIEQWNMQSTQAARLLSRAGYHLYERGQYNEAESFCQRALSMREQILGQDHADVAQSLNDLAVICIALGKSERVEALCLRALSIQERTLGPHHPDVAVTLNDIAMHRYLQGKYEQVEPLYQRAISIFEYELGPVHTNTATALNNLAKLYVVQGKYAEAESLMRQALDIREQVYGHNHPDVANSLHNLAWLSIALGQYTEAESLLQNALTIQEKSLEPFHRNLADTLKDKAQLLFSQNRSEEAEPLYQRALSIFEHIWGPEHPDLARMSAEYNHILEKLGQKA